MRRKKPGRKSVANAKKLHDLFLLLTNIQMLKIKELELHLYLFNKEKYIPLDVYIDGIKILATCTNQS